MQGWVQRVTTVDQRLLKWAHEKVREIVPAEEEKRLKYSTVVKGAPAFIQTCGLAQAVAFWQAKSKGQDGDNAKENEFGYAKLLEHLGKAPGLEGFEVDVRGSELGRYMFLTRRSQLALVFLKRMTDAYLPREVER